MTSLEPGCELDHYRIENEVAKSGMASIFRGTDLHTGRTVAIKIPHFEAESDPVFFDCFHREEAIGRELDHPGVVKVLADGDRSRLYMVQEWIEGRTLRKILNEQKKLPAERARGIVLRICDALHYIHTHGIVHRDLKPENVMVDENDNIKLIDFGIAFKARARRLTFGNFSKKAGTADYISPEQIKGKRGEPSSDLYSLGIIYYEMLTGEVPFAGSNPFVVMHRKLQDNPIPPTEFDPGIAPELQEIICRALQRDPKNRYATAREFASALEHHDQLGVVEHRVLENGRRRTISRRQEFFLYSLLAIIPTIIFALLLYFARYQ